MVAFKAREAARLLQNPDKAFTAFLLYGPDEGLVNDRARSLARSLAAMTDPPGDILRIGERDMAEQPDILAVEAKTMPMFGGPKIIRVTAGPKLKPELVEEVLGSPMEARLLIEAGNLKPASKLRKLFETARRAAALPCYAEGVRDIEALIGEELTAHGFHVPRDVVQYLTLLLGSDFAVARSELRKLALYVDAAPQEGERKTVTIADIDAIMGDSAAPGLDDMITHALMGRPTHMMRQFERLLAQGVACQTILILLIRHLNRLHQVQAQTAQGTSLDQAMKTLRPPVFFKQSGSFKQQCRRWPLPALGAALHLIHTTMKQTRLTPSLERELTAQTLLKLASRKSR